MSAEKLAPNELRESSWGERYGQGGFVKSANKLPAGYSARRREVENGRGRLVWRFVRKKSRLFAWTLMVPLRE